MVGSGGGDAVKKSGDDGGGGGDVSKGSSELTPMNVTFETSTPLWTWWGDNQTVNGTASTPPEGAVAYQTEDVCGNKVTHKANTARFSAKDNPQVWWVWCAWWNTETRGWHTEGCTIAGLKVRDSLGGSGSDAVVRCECLMDRKATQMGGFKGSFGVIKENREEKDKRAVDKKGDAASLLGYIFKRIASSFNVNGVPFEIIPSAMYLCFFPLAVYLIILARLRARVLCGCCPGIKAMKQRHKRAKKLRIQHMTRMHREITSSVSRSKEGKAGEDDALAANQLQMNPMVRQHDFDRLSSVSSRAGSCAPFALNNGPQQQQQQQQPPQPQSLAQTPVESSGQQQPQPQPQLRSSGQRVSMRRFRSSGLEEYSSAYWAQYHDGVKTPKFLQYVFGLKANQNHNTGNIFKCYWQFLCRNHDTLAPFLAPHDPARGHTFYLSMLLAKYAACVAVGTALYHLHSCFKLRDVLGGVGGGDMLGDAGWWQGKAMLAALSLVLQKVPISLMSLLFRLERSRRRANAMQLKPVRFCGLCKVRRAFTVVPWIAFVLLVVVCFGTTIILTSTGFLQSTGSSDATHGFDDDGTHCSCAGITAGEDVEGDWITLLLMIVGFRTLVYRPITILIGTLIFIAIRRRQQRQQQRNRQGGASGEGGAGGGSGGVGSVGGVDGGDGGASVGSEMVSFSLSNASGGREGKDDAVQLQTNPMFNDQRLQRTSAPSSTDLGGETYSVFRRDGRPDDGGADAEEQEQCFDNPMLQIKQQKEQQRQREKQREQHEGAFFEPSDGAQRVGGGGAVDEAVETYASNPMRRARQTEDSAHEHERKRVTSVKRNRAMKKHISCGPLRGGHGSSGRGLGGEGAGGSNAPTEKEKKAALREGRSRGGGGDAQQIAVVDGGGKEDDEAGEEECFSYSNPYHSERRLPSVSGEAGAGEGEAGAGVVGLREQRGSVFF